MPFFKKTRDVSKVEVIFFSEELKSRIDGSTKFSWESKDEKYKRINHLRDEDLMGPDQFLKKINHYQTAGFRIILLCDQMDDPIIDLLLNVSKKISDPVSVITLESSEERLYESLYFPGDAFMDMIQWDLGTYNKVINSIHASARSPLTNALRERLEATGSDLPKW